MHPQASRTPFRGRWLPEHLAGLSWLSPVGWWAAPQPHSGGCHHPHWVLSPELGCSQGPSFCPFPLLPALSGQQTCVCVGFLEQPAVPAPWVGSHCIAVPLGGAGHSLGTLMSPRQPRSPPHVLVPTDRIWHGLRGEDELRPPGPPGGQHPRGGEPGVQSGRLRLGAPHRGQRVHRSARCVPGAPRGCRHPA